MHENEFKIGFQSAIETQGHLRVAIDTFRIKYFMDIPGLFLAGLFGLIVGSFLNVVIHRGPAMWRLVEDESRRGNLMAPRSYCPNCGKTLSWRELIPILSFIFQKGKCAGCQAVISRRYPVVELLGAAAAVLAVIAYGPTPNSILIALFLWTLIAAAAIDFETGYIPDALTLPLIAAGLGVNAFTQITPFPDAVIGAASGYLGFWIIAAGYEQFRKIEGLGLGDAKLLAAIGAWGGWQILFIVVGAASVLGIIGAAYAQLAGSRIQKDTPIAFGPALAAAGAAAVLMQGVSPLFRFYFG